MKFIERLIAYVKDLIAYIKHAVDRGDYRFAIPIAVIPSTGLYLAHHLADLRKSPLNLDGFLAMGALFFLAANIIVPGYLLFKNRDKLRKAGALPEPDALLHKSERLHAVRYRQEDVMRKIQSELVPAIFGSSTPDDPTVWELFRKNNRKSIALYSDNEEAFVGFATVWPLTEKAASDIIGGVRNETQITADDLLPAAENRNAKFCLISAVGVKDSKTSAGKHRAHVLVREFKRFFLDEFVGPEPVTKTILAIAEPDGEKWCDYIKLERVGMVESFAGWRPLYVGEFKHCEIERRLEELF